MKQDNKIPRMLSEPFSPEVRAPKTKRIDSDLVIVGGGLAGTCGAITAARAGIKVVLVQDRPVLGRQRQQRSPALGPRRDLAHGQ